MTPLFRIGLLAAALAAVVADAAWDDREAGLVPVISYGPAEYNSSAFNWAIVTDKRGRIYAGSDSVLEFDGRRWRSLDVNGAPSVRGLAIDAANRLWVGASDELGYFSEDSAGERVYHSLRASIPAGHRLSEVWNVYLDDGLVHFVTAKAVLTWDGAHFTIREFTAKRRIYSFRLGGRLHVSQPGEGLWRFDSSSWQPVDLGGLEKEPIGWGVALGNGKMLLGCAADVLLYDGTRVERTGSQAQEWLRKAMPVTAKRLAPNLNAVATFFGGLLLIDDLGNPIRVLSRASGLPSQSLTGLELADDGSLWISSTHSLFRVEASGATSFFNASNGHDIGIARALFRDPKGKLFASAEEGVAKLEAASGWEAHAQFKRFGELQGLFWTASANRDEPVLLGGTLGIVEWDGSAAKRLYLTSWDVFQFAGVRDNLFALEGNRVVHFQERNRAFPSARTLVEFTEPASGLALDGSGTLWVSGARGGLLSFANPDEENPPMREFRVGAELPSTFKRAELFTVDGRLFAQSANAVLELNNGRIERVNWPETLSIRLVETTGGREAWAICDARDDVPRLTRLTVGPEGLRHEFLACRDLALVGKPEALLRPDPAGPLWISGTSGMLKVDTQLLRPLGPMPAPVLLSARWTSSRGSISLSLSQLPALPFSADSVLSFDLRDPTHLTQSSPSLEYRLGGSEWMAVSGMITFNGMHEGSHVLDVRLRGGGPSTRIAFSIRPPWHRSAWAWTAYLLATAGSIWWLVSWRLRRIKRLNTELQRLVDARTEELTRATAARSAFLANMGHEILNPLNGVVGLVDRLQRRPLSLEDRNIAAQLDTCAKQVVSVIEDVLEYARLEAGRVNLRLQTFEVCEPINAAVQIFAAVQQVNASPIHIEIAEGLKGQLRVGAPDRIRQVLVNYLSNALKFSEGAPVTVSVSATEKDQFIYSVRDLGPGISEAEQPHLFHRFSRTSAARRSDIPGTGLGLAACKSYAEAMGGEVWLESRPGAGATFFLRVPLRPVDKAENPGATVDTGALHNLRALVVDDHELNRSLLVDTLGRLGSKARSAGSIAEAKAVFLEHRPDVVFVDFDLGGSSGADLVVWIRREAPFGRDVPTVATTAYAVEEVRRRCEEAGMDGFISKPVTPWKISEALAKIERTRGGGLVAVGEEANSQSFLHFLAGGNEKQRAELALKISRELRREAAALLWRARRKEWIDAATAAHRIISIVLLLGNPQATETAKALQSAARTSSPSDLLRHYGRLRPLLLRQRNATRLSERPDQAG